jgi:hypothetical protein
MALTQQRIRFLFGGGVDTKSSALTVPIGRLAALENGEFSKLGAVQKRSGYVALSSSYFTEAGTGSVPPGQGLEVCDRTLLLLSSGSAFSYGDGPGRFVDRGHSTRWSVTHRPVSTNTSEQRQPDAATLGGITVHAWQAQGPAGGVYASVQDLSSSLYYQSDVLFDFFGSSPRVVAADGGILVFYAVLAEASSSIRCHRLDPANPTAFGLTVVTANDLRNLTADEALSNQVPPFDACADSGSARVLLLYATGSNGDAVQLTKLAYVSGSGHLMPWPAPVVQSVDYTPLTASHRPAPAALSVSTRPSNGDVLVGRVDWDGDATNAVTEYLAWAYSAALTASIEGVLFNGRAGTDQVVGLAGGCRDDGAYDLVFSARDGNLGVPLPRYYPDTFWAVMDATGGIRNADVDGQPPFLARGVCLAGKVFYQGGSGHVLTVYDSDVQPTYFLYREDGHIDARFLSALASGSDPQATYLASAGHLPSCHRIGPTALLHPVTERRQLDSAGGDRFSVAGTTSARLEFDSDAVYQGAQAGRTLVRAGGVVGTFDGASFTEHGAHLFPERPEVAGVAGSSALDGTYSWVAVYEWRDQTGRIDRSAPSIPQTGFVSGVAVTFRVPVLRQTARSSSFSNETVVALYRTEANPSSADPQYFRVSVVGPQPAGPLDDPPYVEITDSLSDLELVQGEGLYTAAGAVLQNDPPPAAKFVAVAQNRVFLAGLEDNPLAVAFSREAVPGEMPGFNSAFRLQVDPRGGDITALAAIDDKIVVFKERAVFTLNGPGPSDLADDTQAFSQAQLASLDVGCAEPRSVAYTQDGIMFKSEKGIRTMALQGTDFAYSGAPVEGFNGLSVSSAEAVAARSQARFLTREGTTLVYDWFFGQWATHTGQSGSAATVRPDGSYAFLRSDGRVLQSSSGTFTDAGTPYSLALETGWVHLDEALQGTQRVYDVYIIGERRGPHRLRVRAAYDYATLADGSPRWAQDVTWDPDADGAVTSDGRYQVRFSPGRGSDGRDHQQCQSVKLRIEDVAPITGTLGDSFSVTELLFHVGVDGTRARMPPGRSV